MDALWKPIPSFEGYKISTKGEVLSVKKQKLVNHRVSFRSHSVPLYKNGKEYVKKISELVAICFIDNPNNYKYINHLDGNLENNCVENLEWVEKKVRLQQCNIDLSELPISKEEKWKQIKDFPAYYVSNLGRIYSFYQHRLLNPNFKNSHHYGSVSLWKNKKSTVFLVHRLVAEAFIPNPHNYNIIDHIDGIRTNNNVNNLRWCTQLINVNNTITYPKFLATRSLFCKPVRRISSVGEIKEYPSLKDAALDMKCPYQCISKCCNGKRKTYKKYKWIFI